jgi:hypothetical protein
LPVISCAREKILEIGRQKFDDLLKLEREARNERVVGSGTDLTSWQSIERAYMLSNAFQCGLAPRKNKEILAGTGENRERASVPHGVVDLWKRRSAGEQDASPTRRCWRSGGNNWFSDTHESGRSSLVCENVLTYRVFAVTIRTWNFNLKLIDSVSIKSSAATWRRCRPHWP